MIVNFVPPLIEPDFALVALTTGAGRIWALKPIVRWVEPGAGFIVVGTPSTRAGRLKA